MTYGRMKIKVEAEDFVGAVPSAMHCPTARALCRRLGKRLGDVSVWMGCIQIGARHYAAPPEVDAADSRFTRDRQPIPYSFILSNEPIEPVLEKPPERKPKK